MMETKSPLVEVQNVSKYFPINHKMTVNAVQDVSFTIFKGETLGLVGESGCGKTTLGRTIKNIYDVTDGKIFFDGKDITQFNRRQKKAYTKEAQMIFQDPYSSLNPRLTVRDIIKEGMAAHHMYDPKGRDERVDELLELVGLDREHANRFPHEFSGGQRQRIGIARALAVNPSFIVCDEPTSSLDVSIQAQVINLLKDLQDKLGLTYLFIAHNLSMVKYISDRVGVMYLGELIELTDSDTIYETPAHPYTEALMSAIPIPDPEVEASRERIKLEGELPSPINLPKIGCNFFGRCQYAQESCKTRKMTLEEVAPGHYSTCSVVFDKKEK